MEIKKQLLGLFLFIALLPSLLKGQDLKYSKVKIDLKSKRLSELSQLGITVDHGDHKKDSWFITDLSENEIKLLQQNGVNYEILVPDVIKHYQEQKQKPSSPSRNDRNGHCEPQGTINYQTPVNFSYGSMGGFLTYSEMLAELDKMKTLFPDLISSKQAVSTTHLSHEGRPLYYLKISDNPESNEAGPQVLYTALHHAREPASMQQLIFYMYYLLENYATDPEIKALVDNTEMYFIPCVNPDGYLYNESTYPGGGGMWRKNRRSNSNGSFGVDLNRNYGMYWGYDDNGSSPSPSADTYRGLEAFSEPETKAIRDFCNSHTFKFALNYHSYGNLLIYPWGHEPSVYTPDSALFVNYAELLTRENNYTFGTGDQTVGYVVNGDSDDWMYGEQISKPKIFSMTPEVGNEFWPQQEEIEAICKANVAQNLYTAKSAGKFALISDKNDNLISSTTGYLKFNLQRLGLDSTATFTVTVTPVTSNITFPSFSKTYSTLSLLEVKDDSVAFTISGGTQQGAEVRYNLNINNSLYTSSSTITKTFGTPAILAEHNGNSLTGWINNQNWGLHNSVYYSPGSSITDSPNGFYSNDVNKSIKFGNIINLKNASSAYATFYARWDIEPNYDYAQLSASIDGGASWIALCGKYTKTGSIYQDSENPVYDGKQQGWIKEEINLNDFVGENVQLRFTLVSDSYLTADGFYFDDLKVISLQTTTTGMEQLKHANDLFISDCYPNPASNSATINFNADLATSPSLVLVNSLGEQIRTYILTNNSTVTFNIRDLPSGIYFYKISSSKGNSVTKKMLVVK